MNQFLLLTKIQLVNVFRQQNNRSSKLHIGTYFLSALVMAGVSAYYMFLLFGMYPKEQYGPIPYFMAFMETILIFVMGINTSQGMLFGFKDYDLLKAMPISDKQIIFSKIATFTITEYAYAFCFLTPVIVMYGVQAGMGVLFYVLSFLGFLTIPMVPIVLGSFLGVGIQKVSAGKKYAELIKNVLAVVLFLSIYAGAMYLSFSNGGSGAGMLGLVPVLKNILFQVTWYIEGALTGNVLLVLASMAVSIVLYVVFVLLYSTIILKINQTSSVGYHEKNFKLTKVKTNSVFRSLFKKELQRFLKNFLYVFNTTFGMILLIAAAIYILLNANTALEMLFTIIGDNQEAMTILSHILLMIILVAGQMTCTTGCSISLEGKSFWIMKTLPITVTQVFWSKILVNFLLIAIPSLISMVLLGIGFSFDVMYYVYGLLLVVSSALAISFFGLFINLCFPKMQFENDQQVIKQSLSSLLSVMIPMFLSMGVMVLYMLLLKEIPFMFELIVAFYCIACVVLYVLLTTVGKKKYNNITA